jgi:hypothetical protein
MEREVRLANHEVEVLGHLVPVDDGADLERNRGLAAQRLAGAPNRRCVLQPGFETSGWAYSGSQL